MKEIELLDGESVIFQLEGDVFGGGANPITQAIVKIQAKILKILGTTIKATLIVTNKRVITYLETKQCWVIPTSRELKVIMPSSIMEVGYSRVTTCGFFPYFQFFYQGHTEKMSFPVKGGSDEELNNYVKQFYAALNQ